MIEIYCDGGATPNPGEGGIGFVIFRDGEIIITGYQFLGYNKTNNQTEFAAAVNSLAIVKQVLNVKKVTLYTDSQLVYASALKPGTKGYKNVVSRKLIGFHEALLEIICKFEEVKVVKIDRKENGLADALSQRARNLKTSKIIQYGE